MARRKAKWAVALALVRDYGPSIRRKKASVGYSKAVEAVERPPPKPPRRILRGARRVCYYDELWRRGAIDDAQREAFDRYLMESEMEQGARDRPISSTGRTPPWLQGHPAKMQVRAAVSLRGVRSAVGNNGRALADLLVFENFSVRQISERRDEDQKVTMG
ncbi:hypothetical protein [Roseomonas chloroacetimidivorans]|jgi:hypothetical protein|uniref:hypothetical protein n=1 Tax=Roseomonas chloroacetimidivorans TaxID=1766656 RepID=UPI003C7359D3